VPLSPAGSSYRPRDADAKTKRRAISILKALVRGG